MRMVGRDFCLHLLKPHIGLDVLLQVLLAALLDFLAQSALSLKTRSNRFVTGFALASYALRLPFMPHTPRAPQCL